MSDALFTALIGLFSSGFVSATLLPGGSEGLLVWWAAQFPEAHWQLWLAATAGNTLGGWLTLAMGIWCAKRFPLHSQNASRQKAIAQVERFGVWALLLSWLPIIGDPLCFAAGWLTTHRYLALVLIAIGKSLRYLAIILVI